jgi:hypothetical protein
MLGTAKEKMLADASAQPRTRSLPTCPLVTNVPTTQPSDVTAKRLGPYPEQVPQMLAYMSRLL